MVAATQRYKSIGIRVTLLTLCAGLAAIVVLQTYSQKQQDMLLLLLLVMVVVDHSCHTSKCDRSTFDSGMMTSRQVFWQRKKGEQRLISYP